MKYLYPQCSGLWNVWTVTVLARVETTTRAHSHSLLAYWRLAGSEWYFLLYCSHSHWLNRVGSSNMTTVSWGFIKTGPFKSSLPPSDGRKRRTWLRAYAAVLTLHRARASAPGVTAQMAHTIRRRNGNRKMKRRRWNACRQGLCSTTVFSLNVYH